RVVLGLEPLRRADRHRPRARRRTALIGGAAMSVTQAMSPSIEIRDTVLEMYRRMLAGEADAANDLISRDPALIFIGSAGEWIDDQATLRSGTQEPGEGLLAGPNPLGYANGDVGWFADQPSWLFADGT